MNTRVLADEVANMLRDGDWEDELPLDVVDKLEETLIKPLLALLCDHAGHLPVRDHCGKPEHDYCARCHAPTPNLASRPSSTTAVLAPSGEGELGLTD
jgi:hypothetical protein